MRFVSSLLSLCVLSSPSWAQHFIPVAEPVATTYAINHTPLSATAINATSAPQATPSPGTERVIMTIPVAPTQPERKQTQKLFELQANKERPGHALPILGATADRSWQRYLDSFTHPIPEQFEERVQLDSD